MSHPPKYSSPVSVDEMRVGDGARHISFMHDYCRVTKTSIGGKAKSRLKVRSFQQRLTYRLFARDLETGALKHRAALVGMARKNGKSGWGSGITLSVADESDPGAELYICASDRAQAGIVGGVIKQIVRFDPYLSRRFKIYRNEIVIPQDDIRITILSADAATKDGYNPNLVMFDEVHAQPNAELWDAMALGMGARIDPLMVGITTAGKRKDRFGRDTMCYKFYEHGKQIHKGEIEDPTFCFDWWEPEDEDADHLDRKTWEESNPGLDDLVSSADLESVSKRTDEPSFRTKRCNQWVSQMVSAIPKGEWEDRHDPDRKKGRKKTSFAGGKVKVPALWLADTVGFLDGSWSGDSTGIVNCTRDGFAFVVAHHEKTQFDGEDWRVPVNSVKEDIRTAFSAGMRLLLLDPYRWQQTAADLEDEGYPVVEWPTNSLPRIVPAWKDYYAAIADDEITHDGNPAMARHHDNLVLKIDAKGTRPTKESATSVRHIDLAICSIGAYANRNLDIEPEKKRSAWVL